MTTCTDKIWSKLNCGMKFSNGMLCRHVPFSFIYHSFFIAFCCFICCFRGSPICRVDSILLLSVQNLFACFGSSHACHAESILLLSVQSLFTCFRGSPTYLHTLSCSLFKTVCSSDTVTRLCFVVLVSAMHCAFLLEEKA